MSSEEEASSTAPKRKVSCTARFDAVYFCYSPVHQMQQYYRVGKFDNCSGKWKAMVDCLLLKTKPASQVQEILEDEEKSKLKSHIWTFRTPEEASYYWKELYGHLDEPECEFENMAIINNQIGKKACVIGGSGFLAALLIKQLLKKGYAVNTTVRDPAGNLNKISHLLKLQNLGELKIFGADLTVEGDFDAPVSGCELVFQFATTVKFVSEDPENDMIKPAIEGVLNVLKACARAKEVKRVILTSSTDAVTINQLNGTGLVMDESHWTDVEYLTTAKPHGWEYPVSRALAEKAAWEFAEVNHIDLITVIPTLTAGPSITRDIPISVVLATSLINGNDFFVKSLKEMQLLSGSISITHVEDICRAHIFLAEKESASGRYIVCAHNTSVPELAKFLGKRYTQYEIPTEFDDIPYKAKFVISSEKLIKEGFSFKYGIEEIFDHSVEYLRSQGVLLN